MVAPIVAVAAREQVLPELPDDVIVTRDEREQRGPLEGLRAGLKALPDSVDVAYVTSCDVPLLVPGFVTRMIELLGDHDIAVMEIDGFPHPLSAVYRRDTLPQVESLLAQDKLRPVFLFDAVRTRRVQPEEMISVDPELHTLRNLNTREDYLAALSEAGLSSASSAENSSARLTESSPARSWRLRVLALTRLSAFAGRLRKRIVWIRKVRELQSPVSSPERSV